MGRWALILLAPAPRKAGLLFCPRTVGRLEAWIIALSDGRGTENGEWTHLDSSTVRPSTPVYPSSTAAAGAKIPCTRPPIPGCATTSLLLLLPPYIRH